MLRVETMFSVETFQKKLPSKKIYLSTSVTFPLQLPSYASYAYYTSHYSSPFYTDFENALSLSLFELI